ncbi:hypothetical protein ALC60_11221 [Trachymyrmex zeteki]|uniref:Uncharacterized protein n=1 Tax=Mycetomoellerius zeteki TaxID=64791 RepID=A0A151WPE9_9HYME|nr:hypothetical protein ALC60_11221 [Trachymyrmex zeteki]
MVHDGYNAVSIYLNFSRRVVAPRLVDISTENVNRIIHDFKDSLQSAAPPNVLLFVLRVKYLQPQKIKLIPSNNNRQRPNNSTRGSAASRVYRRGNAIRAWIGPRYAGTVAVIIRQMEMLLNRGSFAYVKTALAGAVARRVVPATTVPPAL